MGSIGCSLGRVESAEFVPKRSGWAFCCVDVGEELFGMNGWLVSFSCDLLCFFFCFFFSGELGAVWESDKLAEGGCRAGGGLVIVALACIGPWYDSTYVSVY